MDEKVIIEFAKWITGHDEETIIQMYDDWASSQARQAIQVQAKVSGDFGDIKKFLEHINNRNRTASGTSDEARFVLYADGKNRITVDLSGIRPVELHLNSLNELKEYISQNSR